MGKVFLTKRRVEFRDTDAAGIVHFSVYFVYMEQAEHEFLRHIGVPLHHRVEGMVHSWPRVSATCDYRSPARFEDELSVSIFVAHLGEKSVRYQVRFELDGRRIAEGTTIAAYCQVKSDHSLSAVAIPVSFRQALGEFVPA
jgi:4-hydroxybenzoyl-CoA thioesterase/acyl-CoA thioester hydrolase